MATNSLVSMLEGIVKDKTVLYVIFFFAIANAFGYLATSNYEAFIFFTLIVFISKEFTNHIGLALLSAMVFTNLLISIVQGRRVYETFVSGIEGDGHEKKEPNKKTKDSKKHNGKADQENIDKDAATFNKDVQNFNKLEAMITHQEGLIDSLNRIDDMIDKLKGMSNDVAEQEKTRNANNNN